MKTKINSAGFTLIFILLIILSFIACRDWDVEPPEIVVHEWYFAYVNIKTISGESAELSWDGYSTYPGFDIEGFNITRKIDDGDFETIVSLDMNQKSYTDNNLNTNKHKYYYIIEGYVDTLIFQSIRKEYSFACGFDQYTDFRDSISYNTISDGYYCWFTENLKYLPAVHPPNEFNEDSIRYFVYGYDGSDVDKAKASTNYQSYGTLYSFVSLTNVCPSNDGWIVPRQENWKTLFAMVGGEVVAGGILKEIDTLHWKSPNTGATNAIGFTALPGGMVDEMLKFTNLRNSARFWDSSSSAYELNFNNTIINTSHNAQNTANSVRCIRKLD